MLDSCLTGASKDFVHAVVTTVNSMWSWTAVHRKHSSLVITKHQWLSQPSFSLYHYDPWPWRRLLSSGCLIYSISQPFICWSLISLKSLFLAWWIAKKKKLFWWKLTETLIYEYKSKSLVVCLILYSLSSEIAVNPLLETLIVIIVPNMGFILRSG